MGVARYMVEQTEDEKMATAQLLEVEAALNKMSWIDKMKWRLHESKDERELDKQMRKINQGAFKREVGQNDIERINGPAFPVIYTGSSSMTGNAGPFILSISFCPTSRLNAP